MPKESAQYKYHFGVIVLLLTCSTSKDDNIIQRIAQRREKRLKVKDREKEKKFLCDIEKQKERKKGFYMIQKHRNGVHKS